MRTTILSKETAKEVKKELGLSNDPMSVAEQVKAIQKTLKRNNPLPQYGSSSSEKARQHKLCFGAHKGKTIEEMESLDRPYLLFLLSLETKVIPAYVRNYLEAMASELAGEKFPDGTPMFYFPYGQYKGRSLAEVALDDKQYIAWCIRSTDMIPEEIQETVEAYITVH